MELPLISVIVPVYKVEKYINKCIKSIVEQTYKNIEIILVDDGSPDECPNICDSWALKDNRIKVIHKENGGLSDARNVGLLKATGQFISFVDSDDWIDMHFLEILYSTMIKTGSDIVECGVSKIWSSKEFNEKKSNIDYMNFSKIIKNRNDAVYELITDGLFHQHVWNKLYKIKIIDNFLFKKDKYNEDEFWTYHIFSNAKKVTYIDLNMYYYYQRSDSIMGECFSKKRLDVLDAKHERQSYMESNFPDLAITSKKNYFWTCVYLQQLSLKYSPKEQMRIINQTIRFHVENIQLKLSDFGTFKEKLWFLLIKISFVLACLIRNFFKVGF